MSLSAFCRRISAPPPSPLVIPSPPPHAPLLSPMNHLAHIPSRKHTYQVFSKTFKSVYLNKCLILASISTELGDPLPDSSKVCRLLTCTSNAAVAVTAIVTRLLFN